MHRAVKAINDAMTRCLVRLVYMSKDRRLFCNALGNSAGGMGDEIVDPSSALTTEGGVMR
jgi:hypothetical protein